LQLSDEARDAERVRNAKEHCEMKTTYRMWQRGALALAAVLLLALPAAAQNTVTSADIQRLQDQVYDASADIARMRDANASQATQLQQQLDDLRDEVTYLKVKLRKEGSVPYSEYTDVRDRIQDVRTRDSASAAGVRYSGSRRSAAR
jgi:TolA-binding protein